MPRLLLPLTLGLSLLALPAVAQESSEPEAAEPAPAPSQPPAGPSALERAYQKEVAFLLSERAALQARLDAAKSDGEGRGDAARAEVESLQGRLLGFQRQADAAEQVLDDADNGSRKALESSDLVGSTLEQARTSLTELGVTVSASGDGAEANATSLGEALAAMQTLVADGGRVRSEEGSFFLADGTLTEGTLVKVGRIATYGVSDTGAGPLAPAGQGRLRLANHGTADVAKALQRGGTTPPVAGIFLHESLAQPFAEREGRTFGDIVDAGGPVGLVILGLGVIAMLLVLVRGLSLWTLGRSATQALDLLDAPLRSGQLGKAETLAQGIAGFGPHVALAVLGARDRAHSTLDDVASEALLGAEPRLQRFGTPIQVIAAVAPLLGLLGTVTGMIATFEVITNVGTGNPKLLSGGISEALVTTQLGLIVAIPALLLGNLLGARAERVREQLEQSALAVLNAIGAKTHADDLDAVPSLDTMIVPPNGQQIVPGLPAAPAAPEVASA